MVKFVDEEIGKREEVGFRKKVVSKHRRNGRKEVNLIYHAHGD